MKKNFYSLILIFILVNLSFSQNLKLDLDNTKNFSGRNAWLIDSILCVQDFEGRKSGLIGAQKAVKFISENFKSWGLKPKGENNTYVQKFPMLVTDEITVPELVIHNARRGEIKYFEGDDFAVFTNSGSGVVRAKVAFAGYGFDDSVWNDYKNLDVKGKIVLILGGKPEINSGSLLGKEDRNSKFKTACEKGAAAVLMYNFPGTRLIKGAAIQEQSYNKNVPGAYIQDHVIRELFKGTDKSFDEIIFSLKRENKSFILDKEVSFNVQMKEIDNGYGENVIAMLEGKEKKDEFIVIGAHLDHIGKSAGGYVYHGADDNASGTALMMELARSLSKQKKLKRSLIFIGFGAEEQGLLGSNYFVNYPTVPKEKIALLFNFDMVGVGDGGIGVSGIETLRKYWNEFYSTLNDEEKLKIRLGRAGIGGTDHTGFKLGGIPALSAASSGRHNFYHSPEDTYEKIDSTVLQNVGNIVEKFVLFIADYEGNIINKYRNEKNLFDACNSTAFNSSVELINLKQEEKIIKELEKGIKILPVELDGSSKNINFELGLYFSLQESNRNKITILSNPSEVKAHIYNAQMIVLPIIKNFDGEKNNIAILNKLGMNLYDFTGSKISKNVIENLKGCRIIADADNYKIFLEEKNRDKIVLKDNFENISKLIHSGIDQFNDLVKCGLFILCIENDPDVDELSNLIKFLSIDKTHIDFSGLLNKDPELVYRATKKLKLSGYSDDNIRKLFGENFVNWF